MNFYLGVFVPGTKDVIHVGPAGEGLEGTRLALWRPGDPQQGLATFAFAEEWPLEYWGPEDAAMVAGLYRARGLNPPPLPHEGVGR